MRKTIYLLILSSLTLTTVHAQGFYQVFSPDGMDVWAVGNGGNVFRSYDGGNTWGNMTLSASALRSIAIRGDVVWITGDGGLLIRSTNGGVTWTSSTIAPSGLHSLSFLTDSSGLAVGDSGVILMTTDAGENWTPVSSPTAVHLKAISFKDSLNGWIAGDNGAVLKSTDGGASWTPVAVPGVTKNLRSVAAKGDTVIVSGTDATVAQSFTNGGSWSILDFKIESKSDVNKVLLLSSGATIYCGGGGFIRKTTDAGTTFAYQKHPLLASLYDIYFHDGQKGWACSERTNAILRTTDGGTTWVLPAGTSVNYSWSQKQSTGQTVRGNTFAINGFDKRILYVVLGTTVYQSRDIGETWTSIATIPGGTKTNSFYVSPTDTNLFVVAFGSPDVIRRSTNRGATWTTTLTRAFTEYGMPLEMDPNDSNRLYFGPEDGYLYRSTNFGSTWDTVSNPDFRSPCDFFVVYGKPNIIVCGDGVTGSGNGVIQRSEDGGVSWDSVVIVSGSEIPTIGAGRLDPTLAYATAWSSGGVRRSIDEGKTWTQVQTTGSAWGVDIARDDPNVAMYGVYSGSTSYLTTDGGQTWLTTGLTGSNYAFLCYDRGTFLAQQSGGVYKYYVTYTVPVTNLQTIAVVEPAPGSNWQYNTSHDIVWNSGNIANVRIDYKTTPASAWQQIVASTPAAGGTYPWTIPNAPTAQARVRVSDAVDSVPADSSGLFTISVPAISSIPDSLNFGQVLVGTAASDTLRIYNAGTATLVVSSATLGDSGFVVGRTSFSIPAGSSDTLSVVFAPNATGLYLDTLRLANNSPNPALTVPLSGTGAASVSVSIIVPNGGEVWEYNETHNVTWSGVGLSAVRLEYKTQPSGQWEVIVDSVAAETGSFPWTIPNSPTAQARVKISDVATGTAVDSSDDMFSIVAADIVLSPTSLDFGDVPILQLASDTVRIENAGTAPLVVSQIASDSAAFSPSRTSVTVAPGSSDTISVFFAPTQIRAYSSTLRMTSNAPGSPTSMPLSGMGTSPTSAGPGAYVPTAYVLHQNYPNPFNPSTSIVFEIPRESHITIKVYNALGQELMVPVDRNYAAGVYAVHFDASRLPSGMYIYRMSAADQSGVGKGFVETRRMILVK